MEFKVISTEGGADDYSGRATFTVLESGVLEVKPGDRNGMTRVLYSPARWATVEVQTEEPRWVGRVGSI